MKNKILMLVGFFVFLSLYAYSQSYEVLLKAEDQKNVIAFTHPSNGNILVLEGVRGAQPQNDTYDLFWYSKGVRENIPVATNSYMIGLSVSPDGKYITYSEGSKVVIANDKGTIVNKTYGASLAWTFKPNLLNMIWFDVGSDKKNHLYLNEINIQTGKIEKQKILNNNYLYPQMFVTVRNPNHLYFLEGQNPKGDLAVKCKIVMYDIAKNRFKKLELPKKNYYILDDFTISPDERFALFGDFDEPYLYVVDLKKNKILDKIQRPGDARHYSWAADSSYVVFNMGSLIVKYTLPK